MKVRRGSSCDRSIELKRIKSGELVQFVCPFHQDVKPSDLFVRLDKGGYAPDNDFSKIGVANVKTGKLSFVCPTRSVIHIPAEICTDE